jgi:CRP/FNR family cyclic AMP-dependent transcriptional regulator
MNTKQELVSALQVVPWFQELSEDHFTKILGISHLCEVKKDQILFSEGEKEDYLYIVLEGRLAIDIYSPIRGKIRLFTAEPLEVVGWSAVTPVIRQRTASIQAVLDSRLIALDAQKLRLLCDEDCSLGYIIMKRLANLIAARLMITRLQLLDMFANPSGE